MWRGQRERERERRLSGEGQMQRKDYLGAEGISGLTGNPPKDEDVITPEKNSNSGKKPVCLFLHGLGETGSAKFYKKL